MFACLREKTDLRKARPGPQKLLVRIPNVQPCRFGKDGGVRKIYYLFSQRPLPERAIHSRVLDSRMVGRSGMVGTGNGEFASGGRIFSAQSLDFRDQLRNAGGCVFIVCAAGFVLG